MKKIILFTITLLLSFNVVFAASVEDQIKEFAQREYPNDAEMRSYTFNEQKKHLGI